MTEVSKGDFELACQRGYFDIVKKFVEKNGIYNISYDFGNACEYLISKNAMYYMFRGFKTAFFDENYEIVNYFIKI